MGKPEKIDGIENQVLVHVQVANGKLHVYPKRATDTVVYHVTDPEKADPAKPHEVRWIVSGLQSNQEVRIEAKSQLDAFSEVNFKVPGGCNSNRTGVPRKPAGDNKELWWKYDLVLSGGGVELDRIDPTVIIKDDP
jgi:hypothetical protein